MLRNYNHLYYFHVAAIEGSVVAAAQRLGLRQPTVSEQIKALEKSLGIELFERMATGLRLTEAGRRVFAHTSQMFAAGERIEALMGREEASPVALRIGVCTAIDRVTKIELLLPLLRAGEHVPSIHTADTVDLLRELRNSALDLAFCDSMPPSDMCRGLAVERLNHTELVAVAPALVRPNASWSNIGLASFRPASTYWWETSRYLRMNDLTPRLVVESDDATFLVSVALHVPCVTIVPRAATLEPLHDGRVQLLATLDVPGLAVHALYRDTASARRVIEIVIGG